MGGENMLDIACVQASLDVEIEQTEKEIEEMLRNYPVDDQVSIRTGVVRPDAGGHERLCRERCAMLLRLKQQLRDCGG